MITKKNLWFLTLFSVILVMAIYYISVPTDEITNLVNAETSDVETLNINVTESEAITALRVNRDEELEKEVNAIKAILTDSQKTSDEKNDAYEALKSLNTNKGKEETPLAVGAGPGGLRRIGRRRPAAVPAPQGPGRAGASGGGAGRTGTA